MQNGAGDGQEKGFFTDIQQVVAQDENFPGGQVRIAAGSGLAAANQTLERNLKILHIGCGFFIQDHNVYRQALHAPIFMGA